MVRYAVGYQSRAFVTFGKPIPLGGYDPESRRDVMTLGAPDPRHDRQRSTRCCPRRSSRRRCGRRPRGASSKARADAIIDALRQAERQPRRSAADARRSRPGAPMLADRNIIHLERGGRYRVRERTVLRYYARTIQHLLVPRRPLRTH